MGRTVLDWLREMQSQSQSPKPAQQCKRTSLPPFWELPRRFGFTACAEQIGGADYIVVQGESKGLKLRYRVLKDVIPLVQNKARQRGVDRGGCLPNYFAEALYELADRADIMLHGCDAVVNGIEVHPREACRSRSAEECAREIMEYVKREKPRREKARRVEELYTQLLKRLEDMCPESTRGLANAWWLKSAWEREDRFTKLSTWCEAEAEVRRRGINMLWTYRPEDSLDYFAIVDAGGVQCAVINNEAWCGGRYYYVERRDDGTYLCGVRRGEGCLKASVLYTPFFNSIPLLSVYRLEVLRRRLLSFSLYTHRLTALCLYSTFCSKWRISATGRGSQVAA
jgi:hypothetical protein